MKYFTSMALSLITFSTFASTPNADPAKTAAPKIYVADLGKTKLQWTGKKVLVDSKHWGTIGLKSGTFEVVGNQISKGEFTIDMKSITVTDITDPKNNAKLKGHLESDDFFGVSQNPEAKIVIKTVKPSSKKGIFDISGDLTIKGVTAPITFPAEIATSDTQVTLKGKVIVDRTTFGVKFGSKKFFENLVGDRIIADTFDVDVEVVTTPRA